MPSITSFAQTNPVKLMLIGDSSTGKTGSLASLVAAGYKLRILDLDNGLPVLYNLLTDPSSPYTDGLKKIDLGEAVHYATITDEMKSIKGQIVPVKVSVWDRAVRMLDHWKDGEIDLGKPSSWGRDTVLVIDSLTMLSTAALYFVQMMNAHLLTSTQNEWRRDIGTAQGLLTKLLELLASTTIQCNVVLISHIAFVREANGVMLGADESGGMQKGYPSAIGKAISPRIPRYFNNVIQSQTVGAGAQARRKLCTMPTGMVDLKSSAPMRVKKEYRLETGLAEFFADVEGKK